LTNKRFPLFTLDKPYFTIKLHSDLLEVDLKQGIRGEIEKLAEARPFLRDSIGWLLQTVIPLDVRLWEIETAQADDSGKVNIVIPHRRDITIPLEREESRNLLTKLNELIPIEKEKAVERQKAYEEAVRNREEWVSKLGALPRPP